MAITETMIKNVVQMRLNNGVDTQGRVTTVNQNLGTMSGNASDWDAQKVYNIIEAVSPLLSKSLYEVYHVQTNTLTDE